MIVIAHESFAVRTWIGAAVRGIDITCETLSAAELDRLVTSDDTRLVIASTTMRERNAVQLLAANRAAGRTTPFVVVTDSDEAHVRAFVSDACGTRPERRVLDAGALRQLTAKLLGCELEVAS